jgi:hypothetical protein
MLMTTLLLGLALRCREGWGILLIITCLRKGWNTKKPSLPCNMLLAPVARFFVLRNSLYCETVMSPRK